MYVRVYFCLYWIFKTQVSLYKVRLRCGFPIQIKNLIYRLREGIVTLWTDSNRTYKKRMN